eukprot:15701-Heterococcus_DN1.PRE.2
MHITTKPASRRTARAGLLKKCHGWQQCVHVHTFDHVQMVASICSANNLWAMSLDFIRATLTMHA